MKLTKAHYEKYVLEMENDPWFVRAYKANQTCGARRNRIRTYLAAKGNNYYCLDIEDGEQLRRYFDDRWGIQSDPEGQRKYDDLPNVWVAPQPKQPKQPEQPKPVKEEPIMNSPTPIEITTKTYVNGNDVSTMTDGQIYALIAGEEQRIRELRAIGNQPKRLVAEIAKREAGIQALVTYLDSKE